MRWMVVGAMVSLLGSIGCSAVEPANEGALEQRGLEHARAIAESLSARPPAEASYSFPLPEGWITQSEPLPPPWDPEFPFTGTAELRFPPGWPDPATGQWWSYDYLLWIESGPAITARVLEDAIVGYYEGLVDSCASIPCDPAEFDARLTRLITTPRLTVFAGQADIFDSLGTPITLNLIISSIVCPRSQHRALLFSASPFPLSAPIWDELLGLQLQFRCN